MIELTIGITTFLRDDMLFKCINHLIKNIEIPFYLHVTDSGKMTNEKYKFYDGIKNKLKDKFKVSILPFDFGFGACQRLLFRECETPYYIHLCDDEFPRKGSISIMLNLIKELKPWKVGVVAPVLWEGTKYRYLTKKYWIENRIEGKFLCAKNICVNSTNFSNIKFNESPSKIPFIVSNYTYECGIIDTRILKQVNWDDNFKIDRSHIDFFLQLEKTNWKVVTTPNAIFDHYPIEKGLYKEYKRREKIRNKDIKYLEQKWNIKER